jgi:hypothetical protein
MERRGVRREDVVSETADLRASERRDERVELAWEMSRWGECLMERWWEFWEGMGSVVMTWKRSAMLAVERKEWRREEEEEGKEGPTRRMLSESWTVRERREEIKEGMWGGGEASERDFLREGGREGKESLVERGSRDDW